MSNKHDEIIKDRRADKNNATHSNLTAALLLTALLTEKILAADPKTQHLCKNVLKYEQNAKGRGLDTTSRVFAECVNAEKARASYVPDNARHSAGAAAGGLH